MVDSAGMSILQRPETLTAAVAKHIRDAIVRGDYAPGAALPEIRLADQLGTSRGTVREALRALEDLGLVDIVPHKGSFVSRVTKRRARELYALRTVLEAYAVRLAVERDAFESEGRVALEARLIDLEHAAASGDALPMIEAERALHREIWSRCDNELLLELLSNLQIQTRRLLIYNKIFRADPADEIQMHRDLVAGIVSGDPDQAEAVVRRHIRASADLVLAKMPEEGQPAA
jgi:DNA-binding GntR family transcriptional regulator